jgi:hypothetical protein
MIASGHVVLPPGSRDVRLRGRIKPDAPKWSFLQSVEDYKKEYRRRYQEFLRTGLRPQ